MPLLALLAQRPLHAQRALHVQRQGEHVREPVEHTHLLGGEPSLSGARDDERRVAVHRRREGTARAGAGNFERRALASDDRDDRRLGDGPARESDSRDEGAVTDERSDLALDGRGRMLDRELDGAGLVLARRERGQQPRELVRRPVAHGLRERYPSARTTSVWL